MSIIVLLSLFFFFFRHFFSFFELSYINLSHYIVTWKGDNNYLPFQKTNKSINK